MIWLEFGKDQEMFKHRDCIKRRAQVYKQHSDVAVVIFKLCEDWLGGSGYGILIDLLIVKHTGEGPRWQGICLSHQTSSGIKNSCRDTRCI